MRKKLAILAIVAVFAFATASVCSAQVSNSKTFTLSATIPAAGSILIDPWIAPDEGTPSSLGSALALSFDPLTLDPEFDVLLPNHHFYINVKGVGGAGIPTTTLTFTQGANPNSGAGGHGLGWKGSLTYTYVHWEGGIETPYEMPAHPKELLKDVISDQVTPAQIGAGNYFRAYVGINTGDDTMPTGGEVFTYNDQAGLYDGTLLVSSTIP